MKPFTSLSTSDQLALHLREEILSNRLTGTMPGIKQLVQTLGVNSVAVRKALQQLEHEGLIIPQGNRRKRLISANSESTQQSLRVGILHYDSQNEFRHDALLLKQAFTEAGHTPVIAPKTMHDLGMDTKRIKRVVKSIEVDAWVIYAGSSETLQWFSNYEVPAFAIYGRLNNVSMAGMAIRKTIVTEILIKRLVELGHRRIVLLVREERRKPHHGLPERFFLEQLEAHGIKTGPYNIPDWLETPQGLNQCLNNLLQHTPPTAICVGDPVLCHAVQLHLANRGYITPDNISLYCNDYTESFEWTTPTIAHLSWDHRPTIRRVMQWVKNISQGQEDKKLSYTKATFRDGNTIGPVPDCIRND